MRLMEVPSPTVLPDFVVAHAATLTVGTHRDYHPAGRSCASEAVRRLTGVSGATIGTGNGGEPLWPDGTTGSISHKNGFIWAAVARVQDTAGLGIDVEHVIETARAERISRLVLLPEERRVGSDTLDPALRFALIFSIKESVFKCLYPIVRQRFYYEAFVVGDLSLTEGRFSGTVVRSLGPAVRSGRVLEGRFAVNGEWVYSGLCLPPG
jgi:enterobactin synthetase component D